MSPSDSSSTSRGTEVSLWPWTVAKPWPFVVLANQMMTYLVGGGQQQLNYFAGQTAKPGMASMTSKAPRDRARVNV